MEYRFTDENFEAEVLNSDIPVLVDFYADWCGPCKMMAPIVEQLAEEYDGRIKIGKIDSDENMDTAEEYEVMSIPCFIIFKGGKEVDRVVGGMAKPALAQHLDAVLA